MTFRINSSPTAEASFNQTVTDSNNDDIEIVALDGSASIDSDGEIVSYSWSENDIEIATGVQPEVELAIGIHTITLTVIDNDGATDNDEVMIGVNAPPNASAGSDQTVHDTNGSGSESVTLNGAGSSDSDGTIVSYVWTENSIDLPPES